MQRRLSGFVRKGFSARLISRVHEFGSSNYFKAAFTSSSFRYATSWQRVNTKFLPLSEIPRDRVVRDALTMEIGLAPQLPDTCPKCKVKISNKFTHAPICTGAFKHHTVGTKLEEAVFKALRTYFPGTRKQPRYLANPLIAAKHLNPKLVQGDLAFSTPAGVIIGDVTFTSSVNEAKSNLKVTGFNASKRETDKLKEMVANFDFPPSLFVALGFEAHGAWGGSAYKFIRDRFEFLRDTKAVDANSFYRITQTIGLAIRECNTEYLDFIRDCKV